MFAHAGWRVCVNRLCRLDVSQYRLHRRFQNRLWQECRQKLRRFAVTVARRNILHRFARKHRCCHGMCLSVCPSFDSYITLLVVLSKLQTESENRTCPVFLVVQIFNGPFFKSSD